MIEPPLTQEALENYNAKASHIEAMMQKECPLLTWQVWRYTWETWLLASGFDRSVFEVWARAVVNETEYLETLILLSRDMLHHKAQGIDGIVKMVARQTANAFGRAVVEWKPTE